MRLIVTSASGTNGDGYGTVLAFTPEGELMGGAVALIGSVTLAVSCFIQLAARVSQQRSRSNPGAQPGGSCHPRFGESRWS